MSEMTSTTGQASIVGRGRRPLPVWAKYTGLAAIGVVMAGGFGWAWMQGVSQPLFRQTSPGYSKGLPFHATVADVGQAKAPPVAPVPLPHSAAAVTTTSTGLQLKPMDVWAQTNNAALVGGAQTGTVGAGAGNANTRAPGPWQGPAGTASRQTTSPTENAYARRLHPTATPDAVASVMPNPEWTIPKGTIFHCLPAQPIDTQLPGPVKCTVTSNVWSADGTNILIGRGSTVNGEIQRGLNLGQNRAFVLWTDVLTTHYVTVDLNSPAADDLGEIGVPGIVNEHMWEKLKAAFLLTLVQTASGVALNETQAAGTTSVSIGTYAPDLAEQALAHDLDIPPTLYVSPATPLTVYVNRNLDFCDNGTGRCVYHDAIRADSQ
ncbi:MAG TPA: TrbI/VirB10 family protein [Acetobacteraceae bacterium]|nr:TrbI/VirB10 family protein [Acetobacteraceae bacterium]